MHLMLCIAALVVSLALLLLVRLRPLRPLLLRLRPLALKFTQWISWVL